MIIVESRDFERGSQIQLLLPSRSQAKSFRTCNIQSCKSEVEVPKGCFNTVTTISRVLPSVREVRPVLQHVEAA